MKTIYLIALLVVIGCNNNAQKSAISQRLKAKHNVCAELIIMPYVGDFNELLKDDSDIDFNGDYCKNHFKLIVGNSSFEEYKDRLPAYIQNERLVINDSLETIKILISALLNTTNRHTENIQQDTAMSNYINSESGKLSQHYFDSLYYADYPQNRRVTYDSLGNQFFTVSEAKAIKHTYGQYIIWEPVTGNDLINGTYGSSKFKGEIVNTK